MHRRQHLRCHRLLHIPHLQVFPSRRSPPFCNRRVNRRQRRAAARTTHRRVRPPRRSRLTRRSGQIRAVQSRPTQPAPQCRPMSAPMQGRRSILQSVIPTTTFSIASSGVSLSAIACVPSCSASSAATLPSGCAQRATPNQNSSATPSPRQILPRSDSLPTVLQTQPHAVRHSPFVIRPSSLIRHSDFVLRHSPHAHLLHLPSLRRHNNGGRRTRRLVGALRRLRPVDRDSGRERAWTRSTRFGPHAGECGSD